jgi:ZIP family zinc transporter
MVIEWIIDTIEKISMGNLYIAAFLAGNICLLLTFAGAVPAALGKRVTRNYIDIGLGFSAGIMLVASFTSLILPGIDLGGVDPVLIGFLIGAFFIMFVEKILPHQHLLESTNTSTMLKGKGKAALMIVLAIAIHNFPEGLAVGASVSYNIRDGVLTALAIGIQDIQEGFAITIPLITLGKSVKKSLGIGFLSGASELVMALVPVYITTTSLALLPYILGFAAGSMIFVISHEAIPETFRYGNEDIATIGLLIGFVIMLLLDTML